jgi:hypothetical protein
MQVNVCCPNAYPHNPGAETAGFLAAYRNFVAVIGRYAANNAARKPILEAVNFIDPLGQ